MHGSLRAESDPDGSTAIQLDRPTDKKGTNTRKSRCGESANDGIFVTFKGSVIRLQELKGDMTYRGKCSQCV